MNKRFSLFFLLALFVFCVESIAQDTLRLTLDQAVQMAKDQSLQMHVAKNRYKNGFYSNKSFWRSFYPEIYMDATLPNLNRSLSQVTQNDGTDVFIQRSQAVSNVELNVSQKIAWTGGTLSLTSGLDRIDLFGDQSSTSYLSSPVGITLDQPLFGFNSMIWNIRLQEVQQNQFDRQYDEDVEEVARQASEYYFQLLLADIMLSTAEQNKTYNDTIYQISQGRFSMGKIAENELLQIELALLNSDMVLRQAGLNFQIAELRLKNYLGLIDTMTVAPVLNDVIPLIDIDFQKAMSMALERNSSQIEWQASQLQADRDVASANADRRPNIDLYAYYGLSQSAADLDAVYTNPQDQQLLQVGLRIPIINWGMAKANYQAAVAQKEMTSANYQIALLSFEQQVLSQVRNFELKYKEVELAKRADEIAQKRFFVTQQRFKIGKIEMTDMNLATSEKDAARRSYIQALQSFWDSYFQLRILTHYDFEEQQIIEHETPDVH